MNHYSRNYEADDNARLVGPATSPSDAINKIKPGDRVRLKHSYKPFMIAGKLFFDTQSNLMKITCYSISDAYVQKSFIYELEVLELADEPETVEGYQTKIVKTYKEMMAEPPTEINRQYTAITLQELGALQRIKETVFTKIRK
jgi:hypothetical protein